MPGENFSRRVARAAAVGGGRTYRARTPFSWYAILTVICVVGVFLVAYSRYEVTHPVAKHLKAASPPTRANQWEVGLDLYICGRVKHLAASTDTDEPYTTDGKGVVTIEPGLASTPSLYGGKNAILNAFLVSASVVLENKSLQIPGKAKTPSTTTTTTSTTTTTTTDPKTTTTTATSTTTSTSSTTTTTTVPPPKPIVYKNGQSCAGKKGVVQVKVWKSPSAKTGTLITRDAGSLRFSNGQLITIAFVPKGARIPKPTSAKKIADYLVSNPLGLAS